MYKKLFKWSVFLFIVGFLVYRYFFYYDYINDCFIRIKPSFLEISSVNIKKGIKVLRRTSPIEYRQLCEYVDTINPNIGCGGFGGGCYWASRSGPTREIDISTARDSFLGQTAAVIAHETCHAVQDVRGQPFSEQECYEVDHRVLQRVVDF